MDFNELQRQLDSYTIQRGHCLCTSFDSLFKALKALVNQNICFESIPVNLLKKDSDIFFNKVWESFEKHHSKHLKLWGDEDILNHSRILKSHKEFLATEYKRGITDIPDNFRMRCRKALRDKAQGVNNNNKVTPKKVVQPKMDYRKLLFSGQYIYIKYCPHCQNIQIRNILPGAKNYCRYCIKYSVLYYKKVHDRQFFSNLSLMGKPSKEIPSRPPKPIIYSRKPPQGYQYTVEWAKSMGVNKYRATQMVIEGRIPTIRLGRYRFVKMGEIAPYIQLKDFLKADLPEGVPPYKLIPSRIMTLFKKIGLESEECIITFLKENGDWEARLLRRYGFGQDILACIKHAYEKYIPGE